MALEYFCCFYSYRNKIAKLSDQEVGRLFRALMKYGETGETQELTGREAVAYDFIADDIDRQKAAYQAKCERNRANGQMGASAPDRPRTPPKDKTKTETKDKTNTLKGNNTRSAFTPPTVEEVAAYCRERQNGVDPEQFVDFYSAKGWKIGNQPMKDWKAAVRTWERNQYSGSAKPAQDAGGYVLGEAELGAIERLKRKKEEREGTNHG